MRAATPSSGRPRREGFLPVKDVNRVPLALLKGIDRMRDTLLANTARFARGLPANNALLWGARGMGKSSLVKAVHREVAGLKLVEIHREDIWRRCRICSLICGRRPSTASFCSATISPSRRSTPRTNR